MAITVRATSTAANNFASSESINLPTGTTTGDLTIIIGTLDGNTTITEPAGWSTILNTGFSQFIFYRLYQGGDPSSVTVTAGGTHFWGMAAATFEGCDATTPIDAFNTCVSLPNNAVGDGFGKNFYNAPSVNPNYAADYLLACFLDANGGGGGTITFPSGFSNVVTQAPGPNVAISSKQLSGAGSTGNQKASWHSDTSFNVGVQIALHASGDTPASPASPTVTWSGINTTIQISWPYTVPFSEINAQTGDLECIFATFNNGVTATTPSGWTLQESGGNGNYLFTRVRQNGDSDPSLALSGGATGIVAAIALHTSGAVNGPLIDQKNSQLGSGTPSSATLSSLTPATATEYLIAAWGQVSGSSSTWTPSGSLTTEVTSGYGPSLIVMDTQPASQPTGTFTTESSLNTAIFASELLVQAVMPPSGAPISSIIM